MHPILETLEENAIITEVDCLRLGELSQKRIFAIYDAVYESVLSTQQKQLEKHLESQTSGTDPFSFLASASLRSDSGCWELPCRLQKLELIARFAALYANEITVPLLLERRPGLSSDRAKTLLTHSTLTLVRLRALIEAELVSPVVMRSFHCKHTIGWVDEMTEIVHTVAGQAARDLSTEFRVVYQLPEKAPTGRSTVYIAGPSGFLEHGEGVVTFDEGPNWRAKSWKFDKEGKTEIKGERKLRFVSRIFHQIGSDTTFYLAYGRLKNSRYLTDLRGEAFLLENSTHDEELATSSNAINAMLTHTLPLLDNLPIERLLKIRTEERDSFNRYRASLDRVLREVSSRTKHIGKREARELYRQVIEPELLGMKSELYQEQRRQRRRIVGGLGTLATTVALGVFGGIVPVVAKGIIAAAGAMVGGRLLSKAAEAQCEHGATLREKNDFYFLLRLTQEAAKN